MSEKYDPSQVDELFLTHYELVSRIARVYAPDAVLAADAVQQTYLEFSRGARVGRWDLEQDVAPLLNRMSRTIALRLWKERRAGRPEHLRALEDYLHRKYIEQAPSESPSDENDVAALSGCLKKLPEKSRELIEMRYFLEMSIPEIATIQNISPRNAQQIIRRIREKIRQCITKTLQKLPNDDFRQ